MATHSSTQISVIVPIYKTPLNYFKECMESLYNQTLRDAEFILIFDGENKELLSICETYRKRDSRFKIFIQPHLGVSSTRNFGIKQANGEYIAFVDADDSLHSNTVLETSYNHAQSRKSDIALFNWIWEGIGEKILWPINKDLLTKAEKDFCLKQLICIQNPSFSGAPWAKIFNRKFLLKNNILFKGNCQIGQDRVFNFEAFTLASKISYDNSFFYKYVTNEHSATQQFRDDFLPAVLNYIEELKILSKNKYASFIGRETLYMFYLSWNRSYMNPRNPENFFFRMKKLVRIVISNRFQSLIREIDTNGLPPLVKIESFLLRHKITFWIYLHGVKQTLCH